MATRKCSVECSNVSAVYNYVKHRIKDKFGLVKRYISNAECPKQPIKMINVISELVVKDLIIKDRLSKEHKKQLDALKTERQGSRKRARENDECSEDDWINSPSLNNTFESLDSVNEALLSMTAESMEASIHNVTVLKSLNSLHAKVDKHEKMLTQILDLLKKNSTECAENIVKTKLSQVLDLQHPLNIVQYVQVRYILRTTVCFTNGIHVTSLV